MKTFRSSSSQETKNFGFELGKALLNGKWKKANGKNAAVLSLRGDLGAGKTTFVQGFGKALGIKRRIISPTFVLLRRFVIRQSSFVNFYHLDAYRLKKPDALEALGLKEIFADPKNIVLVEWPENIKKNLPRNAIRLELKHGQKENQRVIISQ